MRVYVCLADGKAHKMVGTEFNGFDEENIQYVTKKVCIAVPLTEAEFLDYAKKRGWVVQPIERLRSEARLAIVTRLQNRTSADCYQAPAFFIRGFPKAAAEQIWGFFEEPVKSSRGRVLTWAVDAPEACAKMVLDLEGCPRSFKGWGASRLLGSGKTIATVVPDLIISHVTTHNGREVLHISFSYVLFQDTGEMHFPKDANKKQIGIAPADEVRLRQLALTTLRAMEELSYPLSKEFVSMVNKSYLPFIEPVPPPPPPTPPTQWRSRPQLSPPEHDLEELAEAWLDGLEQTTA